MTRLHSLSVVVRRELRSTLFGLGVYTVLTAIFLVVSYFGVRRALLQVADNGLEVLLHPISQPFFITVSLAAVYLGLCSAIAISRERDQGTLEVLFYGPIDGWSYVFAKYIQQMLTFVIILMFATLNFFVISEMTHLGFATNLSGLLLLSLFLASCTISFGIFLSAITRRVMVSVVVFLALALFFIGFWVAFQILLGLSGPNLTDVTAYARIIMEAVNNVVKWISPVAYFERGSMALGVGNWNELLKSLVASSIYSVILLGLSVYAFKRKGVLR